MLKNKKLPKRKPCHIGFYEIYPNLYVGKARDIVKIASSFDVLIPLAELSGDIWEYGFDGDILYLPISDFDTLPKPIETKYVKKVINYLKQGKKVAIFCLGGHGRTGYFTSLVLSELGIQDPIYYIRNKYCKHAIESKSQLEAIAKYSNHLELIDRYKDTINSVISIYGISSLYSYDLYSDNEEIITCEYKEEEKTYFSDLLNNELCGDCANCINNICLETGRIVGNTDKACECFMNYGR